MAGIRQWVGGVGRHLRLRRRWVGVADEAPISLSGFRTPRRCRGTQASQYLPDRKGRLPDKAQPRFVVPCPASITVENVARGVDPEVDPVRDEGTVPGPDASPALGQVRNHAEEVATAIDREQAPVHVDGDAWVGAFVSEQGHRPLLVMDGSIAHASKGPVSEALRN